MDTSLDGVSIGFDEVMAGYVGLAPAGFGPGREAGEAEGRQLEIRVHVHVPDVARFIAEPSHQGQLSGTLVCEALGGVCTVEGGLFGLLTDTEDANRKRMSYQLHCRMPDGRAITFDGNKRVQPDAPFDLWPDTTTLYVNIYEGHINPDDPGAAPWLYTGILNLGYGDFARLLGTLRAKTPSGENSVAGLMAFGRFFAGRLIEVYGHCSPQPETPQDHRYAPFTLEGVAEATKTLIPVDTGDGLSLLLTRFQRGEPCQDVVLLTHGLTSATNMFYMPEHRNLVQTLLDHGYRDVWALDHRGSSRFPYNLRRHRYNLDDIALEDLPAAVAEIRRQRGPDVRIHVIAHCIGATTTAMALFGGTLKGIRSAILSSVALTPWVPGWSRFKLTIGPWASDYLMGADYFNPSWGRDPGFSFGKLLAKGLKFFHRECGSPECHMLSFMWGTGFPAVFEHRNLADVTHRRLQDLFGGTGVHYYRHVLKMVRANNTAVKMEPGNPRYDALPDNYFDKAAEMSTPLLLAAGQENRVFFRSNELCFQRLEAVVPGRHQLRMIPHYGHQDMFIGKDSARDVFPYFIEFLKGHSHD